VKKAFTIVELLFAVFIFSTLTLTIISYTNFNLINNHSLKLKLNAYILADNILKEEDDKTYNSDFYKIKIIDETKKLKQIFDYDIEGISFLEQKIKYKLIKISWKNQNKNYEIELEKF